MYHYMAALYQRFFQAPDFTELEEEIEQTRQEVRDYLGQPERRKLMQLVDAQNLLREEISLASFIAGFKLAQELAKELEVAPHGKETSYWRGQHQETEGWPLGGAVHGWVRSQDRKTDHQECAG